MKGELNQLITLNPLYINIGNSVVFVDFAGKYPQKHYIFRFKLLSITLSSNIANLDGNCILITRVGLNASKEGDINGNKTNILGIIHTESITNWNQLKNTSS